jgi:hypothetical protein
VPASQATVGILTVILTGCVSSLSFTAPRDVNLAGAWKINTALSDDPLAVLAREGRGRVGRQGPWGSSNTQREDMLELMEQLLKAREQLEIEQLPRALTVKSADESNTCNTGKTTHISMADGTTADVFCGWDGKVFVMEIKPSEGLTHIERYELTEGGKRLKAITELRGGLVMSVKRTGGLKIERIYERVAANEV